MPLPCVPFPNANDVEQPSWGVGPWNDDGLGGTSKSLGFFGRNFLFAAVKQVTECDTARTCEMNSFGNPIG